MKDGNYRERKKEKIVRLEINMKIKRIVRQ